MDASELALLTLAVTPSGALSPGPLTAVAAALGARGGGWRTGVLVAVGHTLAELPYLVLLAFALERMMPILSGTTGRYLVVAASAVVLYFAALLLRDAARGAGIGDAAFNLSVGPVAAGALLTGLNVYFLLWWASIGLKLVAGAAALGVAGFAIMYASHVWMDYVWLGVIAEAGSRAASLTGSRGYRVLLAVLGLVLLLFGADMLSSQLLGKAILT